MEGPRSITLDDFARRFALRSPTLMWFLGAGASAAAGVATAADMVWDFKRMLYCSTRGVSPRSVEDLSDPVVRRRVQEFIDGEERFPSAGEPGEYASLFEAVYPAETDRQEYIATKLSGAKASYGHLALATLMRADRLPVVWSTNFDTLVADAAATVYGNTSALTTVTLDAPELAEQAISAGRLPVEVKLHGDFRSRRLKNTATELRAQDQRLRSLLRAQCGAFGLIVAGYSGRDESVMETLESVLDLGTPYPRGLFWLSRGDPIESVVSLLAKATSAGVEAFLVSIEQFDEVLVDLVRQIPELDTTALDHFGDSRKLRTPARRISGRSGWPVIRTNALEVLEYPHTCRLALCSIGGTRDVRTAIQLAGADVVAIRSGAGVLAFGRDSEVQTAFAAHQLSKMDLHALRPYDPGHRGLLRDVLTRALARDRPLSVRHRREEDFLAPSVPNDPFFAPVAALVPAMGGKVPRTEVLWAEGLAVRLEWFQDSLWLLIEPRIVLANTDDATQRQVAVDWMREHTARRYNRAWNALVEAWAVLLAGTEQLCAFGLSDGIDATFRLSSTTAFSRRASA